MHILTSAGLMLYFHIVASVLVHSAMGSPCSSIHLRAASRPSRGIVKGIRRGVAVWNLSRGKNHLKISFDKLNIYASLLMDHLGPRDMVTLADQGGPLHFFQGVQNS